MNARTATPFQIVKKLSIKTMYGKVSVRDIPQNGELEIGTIMGRVVNTKSVTTDFGTSVALQGDFRGVNSKGERFAAMVCYLPAVAANAVAARFSGSPVDFAFKISAKDNPESSVGYEYICEPINVNDGPAVDPLAGLFEKATGQKLISAPAEPAQTVREAADKSKSAKKK